jgi:DNA-binding GntR family transcriptional regulator
MPDRPSNSGLRHRDLADLLSAEIASGVPPVGERFPTEFELVQRFDVGRHTIREALKLLTEQGLLGRRRKTGTVVLAASPISHYAHSLRDLLGLLDFAKNTVLDIRYENVVMASDKNAAEFAGLPDRRWLRIAGLRSTRSDGRPLCWSEVFVPERFASARADFRKADRAIYERVLETQALKLEYVEQDVTAIDLTPPIAQLLAAGHSAAGLLVTRRYVAHTGDTFEISRNIYPAGRYSMRSVLRQRA